MKFPAFYIANPDAVPTWSWTVYAYVYPEDVDTRMHFQFNNSQASDEPGYDLRYFLMQQAAI
jgi:hypothetical protein